MPRSATLERMQTVVGVLRGGPSREHDVSLKTGHTILTNLPEDRFIARDIYIDRQGNWHLFGKQTTPEKALRQTDVVVIGLHGEYGEDGGVQKLLERQGIPYTGSRSFASFLAMHKLMSKVRAEDIHIQTPSYRYVEATEDVDAAAREIIRTFLQPVIVKPVAWGSSVGVSRVAGFAPLRSALESLIAEGVTGILVEEYIRGKEAAVGVIEHMRGDALYALPAVEIVPPEQDFFSYEAKYSGATREIIPGNFSRVVAEDLAAIAKRMHEALGLRQYSRSDFVVSPKGIYYLETNSLPGLTGESLFPKALAAVGIPLSDFLAHLVDRAHF